MSAARQPPAPPPEVGAEWTCLAHAGFDALIRQGDVQLVVSSVFATGVPDVVRQTQPNYVLDLGHGLARPTPMTYDAVKLVCTLSFGGVNHEVTIPWCAVVAVRKHPGTGPAPTRQNKRTSHLTLVP